MSSSRNAREVLEASGLAPRFEVVADGVVAAAEHIAGKPAPDMFLNAAARLGVAAADAVVVEDAVSGVAAGRAGGLRPRRRRRPRRRPGCAARARRRPRRRRPRGAALPVKTRAPEHLDLARFPLDPWRLVEKEYDADDLGLTETLFAVGNGYLGMRANPEEGREAYSHGTYLNGFHETWHIHHAEEAFGFAKTRPDHRQRARRQVDEALHRRRAAAADERRPRGVRAGPRLPRRHAHPRPRLADPCRQAGAGAFATRSSASPIATSRC